MRDKIIKTIKKVAADQDLKINASNVKFDAPLKDVGIDSISAINLIVGIEQELGVRVPDDRLSKIATINSLIDEFESLLKKK